jgi:hypothetical protein
MGDNDHHETQIYQLRAVLRGISPLIWRRLLLRSDSTVAQCRFAFKTRLFAFHDETFCLAVSFSAPTHGAQ